MRRLMLLRHAKTERDSASGQDHDRMLDARGREDSLLTGAWMARHDYAADLALVSDAVRAQETWSLLTQHLKNVPAKNLPELYGAEPGEILGVIHDASSADPQRLLIVAHNPGLHELALILLATSETAGRQALAGNLPTSGLVLIDFEGDDWRNVAFGSGRFRNFVTPKTMREG